jgi:PKD repeat protein
VVDSGTPTTDNPITVTMDADHAAVAACTVPAPPTALVAEAGGPYGGTAGSPVNLSGSASGGTSPYTCDWDLDNDGTYETPGQDVSHTWASAGDYTVGLQVTDSASRANVATDTASVHITAPPPPPPGGVGGEAFPPNKLAILAPWLALAVAIIAGATILMRRRRAQE